MLKKSLAILLVLLLCPAVVCAQTHKVTLKGTIGPISVKPDTEIILVLNEATIVSETSAVTLGDNASATLIMKNGTVNRLDAGDGHAVIAGANACLIICCESAGIGHECNETCGRLILSQDDDTAGIETDPNGVVRFTEGRYVWPAQTAPKE